MAIWSISCSHHVDLREGLDLQYRRSFQANVCVYRYFDLKQLSQICAIKRTRVNLDWVCGTSLSSIENGCSERVSGVGESLT